MQLSTHPRGGRAAEPSSLNILAVGPLPHIRAGVRSLDFGVSVFNAEMLPGLARLGHRVRVIAEAPIPASETTRNSFGAGIDRFELCPETFEFRRGTVPPSRAELDNVRAQLAPIFESAVAHERPDIVIVGRESLAWHLADLCERHRLPSLLIVHGSPTAALREGVYPRAVMEDFIAHLRRMTAIVSVANHLAGVLESIGVTNVCVIPNAADIERFRPAIKNPRLLKKLGIDTEQPIVAHISTFNSSKSLSDVIASAEIVLKSEPRAVYLALGEGPDREALETVCRSKRIAGGFRFVGRIEHPQMPEYLNLADIVVHPGRSEGCPFIYRETQACGRVLLASDIPAAREAIVDGATGLCFMAGNAPDLASKTLALIANPALRSHIGASARAAAELRHREHWVEEYAAALRRTVLGQSTRP